MSPLTALQSCSDGIPLTLPDAVSVTREALGAHRSGPLMLGKSGECSGCAGWFRQGCVDRMAHGRIGMAILYFSCVYDLFPVLSVLPIELKQSNSNVLALGHHWMKDIFILINQYLE